MHQLHDAAELPQRARATATMSELERRPAAEATVSVASASNTQHCLPLNREVAGTVLHCTLHLGLCRNPFLKHVNFQLKSCSPVSFHCVFQMQSRHFSGLGQRARRAREGRRIGRVRGEGRKTSRVRGEGRRRLVPQFYANEN